MKDVAQKLLDGLELGSGGFVDIRLQNSSAVSLQFQNGLAKEVNSTRMGGASVRALIDGAWGFSTTAELTKKTLKQALESAISMAKVASQKIKNPRKISDKFATQGKAKLDFDVNPKDVSLEEKIELTRDFEKNIRQVDEKIVRSTVNYLEKTQSETILSSNGTEVVTESGSFRLRGTAVSREGTLQQTVSDDVASSAGLKAILDFNVTERGTALGEKAMKLLSAEKPPSGRMNIVMGPSLVGVFIHEAFGHACEADGIITNRSILTGKLNKQVGVEAISIKDDPTIPGLRGSFVYDSEGTKAHPRHLVKDGILTAYFHTLETATMLDLEPNGAGRAMDFRYPPLARMGNTFVEGGDKALEELFELVGDGIYLMDSYGGYVHPAKGQFMFSAQQGYVINDGKQGALTQNVSMSGMIMEVLKNTLGVGEDLVYAFNGTCGKGGQWVPVTGGGPPIAVANLVVGGR
ncbi:MAG: hypothetical protein GF308_06340 [Candidatus Heimdallarchaeota archaeon]|nr:hypothetical protein [Candidatus Heimdallarchaeota archaeon]